DGLIIRQIEKTLGTRLERRRLPEFEYGSGFDPERQFPQTSSRSSSLPRSFGSRGSRRRR
ncbi:ATP-dependent helicase, partial [Candidatus Bipolaricaulota bacterium]